MPRALCTYTMVMAWKKLLFFNGIIRTGLNKVDSTTLGHL